MLQSMGSQRVKHDLEAEQEQMEKYPIRGRIKQKKKKKKLHGKTREVYRSHIRQTIKDNYSTLIKN